jgi:hypothetical protein
LGPVAPQQLATWWSRWLGRNARAQTGGGGGGGGGINLSAVFKVILQKFFLMIAAKSLFLAIHNFCG